MPKYAQKKKFKNEHNKKSIGASLIQVLWTLVLSSPTFFLIKKKKSTKP